MVVTPLLGKLSVFDSALARLGRKRRVVLTTPHHLILPLLIEEDPTLIGTVPEVLARAWQRRGPLKTFKLPFEFPPFEIAQYWHGRFHTDRQHTWFRNLIAACFQRRPGAAEAPADMNGAHEPNERRAMVGWLRLAVDWFSSFQPPGIEGFRILPAEKGGVDIPYDRHLTISRPRPTLHPGNLDGADFPPAPSPPRTASPYSSCIGSSAQPAQR